MITKIVNLFLSIIIRQLHPFSRPRRQELDGWKYPGNLDRSYGKLKKEAKKELKKIVNYGIVLTPISLQVT
jgi:hypothetical protein